MAGKSSTKLRTFPRIPVFICEYHHDALRFIQKCFGSRHLAMSPEYSPQLIHFDAHPDLVVPDVDLGVLYDRDQLVDELSIENWIIPLCATGLVEDITWIKQEWASQIPGGLHSFTVGVASHDGTKDRLAVDSQLEYFVGEGNVVPGANHLRDAHKVRLHVMDLDDTANDCLFSSRPIILDIDLDFYSTNNPFWGIYKKAGLYAELKDIYQFKMNPYNIPDTVYRRREQLKYLKSIFMYLEEKRTLDDFPGRDHELFPEIEYLVKVLGEHYDLSAVDFLLIHDAGCTWDTFGLPDHRSTPEEIKVALERTEKFLRSLPDPVIITMSRSTEDDYCPTDQVEDIQQRVLDMMKNVYAERLEENPIYFYKSDSMSPEQGTHADLKKEQE